MRRPLGSVALLLGIVGSLAFAGPAAAAFPGTNGRITFVSNRDGNKEIYTANADGTDPKRLTANTVDDTDPAYSPDGTKILFARSFDIWVMNADGTGQTAVTGIEGPDSEPAWSRDGTQIVYVSNQTVPGGGTTGPQLFVRNLDGSGLRQVTDQGASRAPAWSPTSDTIAYHSNSDGGFEIYTIPASTTAGAGTRRSANEVGQNYQNPSWSPDGTRIAFERGTGTNVGGDTTKDIYVMNADGSSPVPLTSNAVYDAQPSFSPDGNQIAFESMADGTDLEIYTMAATPPSSAAPVTNTTSLIADQAPDWGKFFTPPEPEPDPEPGGGGGGGGGGTGGGGGGESDGSLPPSCNQTVGFGTLEAIGCFEPYKGGWLSTGNLWINGIAFIAQGNARLWIDPKGSRLDSLGGLFNVGVGKDLIKAGEIKWDLGQVVGALVATIRAGAASRLGRVQAVGDIKIRFLRGAVAQLLGAGKMRFAEILQRLCGSRCPSVTADIVMFTDNKSGLQERGLKLSAKNIPLGVLAVEKIELTWDPTQDRWEGDGSIVTISAFPIRAKLHWITTGDRNISVTANLSGIRTPISNIVFLKRLDLALRSDPRPEAEGALTTTAGPTINGTPLVQTDGSFGLALGPGGFIKAQGQVSLLGFPAAQGHFEWYPTAAFNFGLSARLAWPNDGKSSNSVELGAALEGWASGGRFGGTGTGTGRILDKQLTIEAAFSTLGLAACGQVGWFRLGISYRFRDRVVTLPACDIGLFRAAAGARAAQGGPRTVRLGNSPRGTMLRVRGNGGAPKVILDGPHGQHVEASEDGSPVSTANALVLQDPDGSATYVALRKPVGAWTLSTAAGSPTVARVESADILERPSVSAKVSGHGARRTLSWNLKPRPGQKVTFTEKGSDSVATLKTTSAAHGRVRFSPADGNGRARRIIAMVEQNGMPRDSRTVARYKAPSWRKPAKPRKLRARRSGSNLVVTWGAATGASRYEVYVTAADGERELFLVSAKKRRLKVRGIQKDDSAKVQVAGMRVDGALGKAAKLSVRPVKKRR